MESGATVRIELLPSKQFQMNGRDTHFRLAESQFYRMCGPLRAQYSVTKVEYVVNPTLLARYDAFKAAMVQRGEAINELISFHGTSSLAVDGICAEGFKIGGEDVADA